MSIACSPSFREKLTKRAGAISLARSFFSEKGIVETDPLFLSPKASVDVAIDLFSTQSIHHEKRFLFSSPEYPMKRMLSQGSGDIFFLGHVFRDEPHGQKHSPEFLLTEWYRQGFSFRQMIEETIEFTELFIGKRKHLFLSYKEAFLKYAAIDPFASTREDLEAFCKKTSIFDTYPVEKSSKNDILNIILGTCIEPCFPKDLIISLYHYPASQAALAQHVQVDGNLVAERFELYSEGLELANGYHELAESQEQRRRFLADNQERVSLGKKAYPIDEKFLLSLSSLPDCCGVAVGIDRLFMIQEQATTIDQIIPIPWTET